MHACTPPLPEVAQLTGRAIATAAPNCFGHLEGRRFYVINDASNRMEGTIALVAPEPCCPDSVVLHQSKIDGWEAGQTTPLNNPTSSLVGTGGLLPGALRCLLLLGRAEFAAMERAPFAEPQVAGLAQHASGELAPVLPPCRCAKVDLVEVVARGWVVAVLVRALLRRLFKRPVHRPLERAPPKESVVARLAEDVADNRAPVLLPRGHPLLYSEEVSPLAWKVAVLVRAFPCRYGELSVPRPLERAPSLVSLIACVAQRLSNELGPVPSPRRLSLFDGIVVAALLRRVAVSIKTLPLAAARHASPPLLNAPLPLYVQLRKNTLLAKVVR